uniref:BTB domain-containing protein n=1 Tax=Tetranychus urticae TaxID=32264 RepID=T1JUI6_TETUR
MSVQKIGFVRRTQYSSLSYLDNKFIDLTIYNRGKEYRVHKIIVCSAIPYFAEMFSSEKEESSINRIEVDHPTELFDIIIDWAYDRTIYITRQNKSELKELADRLGMFSLVMLFRYASNIPRRISQYSHPPLKYLDNKFIDLTIYNRGKEYRVHKIILCSFIPYFNAMFSSGLEESISNKVEVDHPTKIFEMIIDWAYDRRIVITTANSSELKKLADYFCLEDLRDFNERLKRGIRFTAACDQFRLT